MVLSVWTVCFLFIGAQAAVKRGFKSNPTTVRIFENDTVLLPCYAEDLGVQTRVRWWKAAGPLLLIDTFDPPMVAPEKVRMWPNRSLELFHVQREDSGKYVCQVSRPAPWGHVTQIQEIEVLYPPSVQPVPRTGELEVNFGEEVVMACEMKGVPRPVLSWRTQDGEIPLLNWREELRFHADNRSLAKRYTCVADNGIGDPAVAHIDLRIRYKPEIEVRKIWVHATPGIRAQLDCRVTAWPEAKVEWFFKGEKVTYSSRIVKHNAESDHSLVIRNVRTSDYGNYLCRASNLLGITEAMFELSGIANPAVFKDVRAISNTAYNFIWEVDSYSPIIEYQFWFRKYSRGVQQGWHKLFIPIGSESIGPVHARSFNLTGLAEATEYEALVLSRNRYGLSRPSRVLRFSTEGAATDADTDSGTEAVPEETIIPVVQLASMSQHSPFDADNNGSSQTRENFLVTVLPILCVLIVNVMEYTVRI